MSSSNTPPEDASGAELLGWVTNFLSRDGNSAGDLLSSSLVGLIISPFVAGINIINAVTGFFTTPFNEVADALGNLSSAFFDAPSELISEGFNISSQALSSVFGDTLVGIFGGPIAVGVVLLSLFLGVQYLQEDETGDTLIGLPIDVPTGILGVEEEDEQNE